MKRLLSFAFLALPFLLPAQRMVKSLETDVLVIGGGVGGTAAAIQSASKNNFDRTYTYAWRYADGCRCKLYRWK